MRLPSALAPPEGGGNPAGATEANKKIRADRTDHHKHGKVAIRLHGPKRRPPCRFFSGGNGRNQRTNAAVSAAREYRLVIWAEDPAFLRLSPPEGLLQRTLWDGKEQPAAGRSMTATSLEMAASGAKIIAART
jgi:hypothetical protein